MATHSQDGEESPPAFQSSPARTRRRRLVRCLLWLSALSLAALFFAWAVLVLGMQGQLFILFGREMEPSFRAGDRVLVTRRPLRLSRGDVVVLPSPADEEARKLAIRRVVALEGDTVECRQGQWVVNGQPIERRRVTGPAAGNEELWEETLEGVRYETLVLSRRTPRNMDASRVPAGSVFLLADSRDAAEDSRIWGPVPLERLVGEVQLVVTRASRLP